MPAPRGTAPTSSQVTASVIKFRCLYTHDLRRKSKRWQDGYLRYHAFNKRVMVYDEQGNYIGDHHWRSTDEVQDGDELELDKGALIQVGERMSTTQTDLSNLFEKRTSSQGSPQSNGTASQAPRTSTPIRSSGSSQPFRSLNDLLGIKKTPIGHLVSPYEERHAPAPSSITPESSDRAPKRQKVSLAGTAAVQPRNTQAQVVDLTQSDNGPAITNVRNATLTREAPRPQKASRSSPARPPENRSRDGHKETDSQRFDSPTFARPQKVSRSSPLPPPANTSRDAPKATNSHKPNSPTFVKPPLPPPSALSTSHPKPVARPAAQNTHPEPPENRNLPNTTLPSASRPAPDTSSNTSIKTLRMATEKPRRKLMYSALLPGDTSQKSSPTPPMNPPPEKRSHSASRTLKSQAAGTAAPELESTNAEFFPSDSTQFILEEMVDGSNFGTGLSRQPTNPTRRGQGVPAPRNLPARRSLDAPLRKSLSDPTALTANPSLHRRPTLMRSATSAAPNEPEPHEEGPWTSEALDLFDFWPPGRPKPG